MSHKWYFQILQRPWEILVSLLSIDNISIASDGSDLLPGCCANLLQKFIIICYFYESSANCLFLGFMSKLFLFQQNWRWLKWNCTKKGFATFSIVFRSNILTLFKVWIYVCFKQTGDKILSEIKFKIQNQ